MSLKVYCYDKCGTCKKAFAYLERNHIAFDKIPIRETPPTKTAIKKMLSHYDGAIKKLFNTSSKDYKEGNYKERIDTLTRDQVAQILSTHGNLVKRPFVLGEDFGLVGFKEAQWDAVFRPR